MTAMQTWELYGLRDEQEKYFQQMKSQLGFERQRNWSEEGKTSSAIRWIDRCSTSRKRWILS